MPNKRAPGQKPILLPLTQEFLDAIDDAYRVEGFDDRSKFVRAAVREKLERLGYKVSLESTLAPGRRRTGSAATRYPLHKPAGAELNEPSSKTASVAAKLLKKHSASGQ